MFTDKVVLELRAGDGGDGIVAWRREKYIPKGGPFGGDGGRGGSVIIESDQALYSLDRYRQKKQVIAENGHRGGANCCQGRDGKDQLLKVPCGTLVRCVESGEILFDLAEHGVSYSPCLGGKGGRGNAHFKSAVNRAPLEFTTGEPGQVRLIELELKLIADIGLVGFPNAGKSTLLSATTAANAKIGNYPFTTLTPNLGTLEGECADRYVMADIPGIIQGAHQNKGLGLSFLRHIDRTRILLFVLDVSGFEGNDPCQEFQILMDELMAYNPLLLHKPFFVALNKVDLASSVEWIEKFKERYPMDKELLFEISARTGQGLFELVRSLKRKLIK